MTTTIENEFVNVEVVIFVQGDTSRHISPLFRLRSRIYNVWGQKGVLVRLPEQVAEVVSQEITVLEGIGKSKVVLQVRASKDA